jgi:competence protein ComFC
MRRLLHLYKYGGKTGLTAFFTERMENFISQNNLPMHQVDAIIPIPLSSARERDRGFNQARLLAKALSGRFERPLLDCLERKRNTKNQARLSKKERWTNLKDAFRIKYHYSYKHKNFLVVDDLLTTGATVSEAAKVLKKAGAAKIYILTLAVAESGQHK